MKYILFLSLLTLFSCSESRLIQKAKKAQDKLLKHYPDAVVPVDTVYTFVNNTDTITEVDTLDNVITITRTIRDTVEKLVYLQPDYSKIKTNSQTRQEERTKRTTVRNETKKENRKAKEETKQNKSDNKKDVKIKRIENRGAPWWLAIFLMILFGVIGWMLNDKLKGK